MWFWANAKRRVVPATTIALLYLTSFALSADLIGRASVIDGDTIEINGQRIRLHGVDAPEKGQECFQPDGSPWHCGQKGALPFADFIGDSPVS